MSRTQAELKLFHALLVLFLTAWLGLTQSASAVFLPQDHSDLFAANSSPAEHQENSSLPPENRVWENFGNANEITPADELNSLQLRWESHFGKLENASGVLSYADGNPISLSDPFGLCAESGGGVWNTLKGAGQAQWNNLNAGAGFLMDGVANGIISVPQGMAWTTDQAHHVLNGSWSSLGSGGINSGMINSMESAKNPYGNQGYYEPGMASDVREAAIGAAAVVYGGGLRGGGAAGATEGRAVNAIEDFLGGQGRVIRNADGDAILMNGDRKIRFDINDPHGDAGHFHIEQQTPSGRWKDAGPDHRYYFKEGGQ